MQGDSKSGLEGQEKVARLVGLLRHERPARDDHWLGLSRAVRFRIEQEQAEREAVALRRSAESGWARWWAAVVHAGWGRWLEPSAWVPTVLAAVAILAWLLPSPHGPGTGRDGTHMAGFGNVPEPGLALGQERPKVAPIVGLHLRIIFLDSDRLPEGFEAFPPLPEGVLKRGR